MTKHLLAFLGAVVIGVAIYGAYLYPKVVIPPFGSTPQGSTGTTARQFNIYGVNLGSPGANGTSSSETNNTGQDLYITAIKAGCESVATSKVAYTGGGLAALTLSVATTSTSAPAAFPAGYNIVGGGTLTIPTSTPNSGLASSTMAFGSSGISTTSIIWGAGTILTFMTNATNTAICTFGVDAFNA